MIDHSQRHSQLHQLQLGVGLGAEFDYLSIRSRFQITRPQCVAGEQQPAGIHRFGDMSEFTSYSVGCRCYFLFEIRLFSDPPTPICRVRVSDSAHIRVEIRSQPLDSRLDDMSQLIQRLLCFFFGTV